MQGCRHVCSRMKAPAMPCLAWPAAPAALPCKTGAKHGLHHETAMSVGCSTQPGLAWVCVLSSCDTASCLLQNETIKAHRLDETRAFTKALLVLLQ